MAWNRNNGNGENPTKVRSWKPHLLILFVVVTAICARLFFALSSGKEEMAIEEEVAPRRHIQERTPETNAVQTVETPPIEPEEEYIIVNGKKVMLAADPKRGKPKYDKNIRIIPMRKSDIKPKRFEYEAEEDIAVLLEVEPGTPMYGEIPFGKHFKDSLVRSLTAPIEIKPTDDAYTVELKKQVQAVKDEFKKLLLDGGDPAEEMRKTRQELIRLGQYRTQLIGELNELRKSGDYTSQDMKDYLEAANKMMEEKGLKPITMPKALLRNMELRERKNQK